MDLQEGSLELTASEIQVLLECLKYSIQRVSDAQGTPYSVRQENLQRLYSVQDKLRQYGKEADK
jgi:hypothetical protein